jgi:DNA polymerase-3 subunit alpha
MAAEFVHLHVHSQYSMLDSALKVKELVKRAAKMDMRAVALTDHANMFGAVTFYKTAKEAGVQAILGSEIEIAASGHGQHLPLLATSIAGYHNLVWLVSQGHVRPDPAGGGSPCISLDTLSGRTEGLIALTGCMGGVVAQRILESGEEAGQRMIESLLTYFPKDNLYIELQDHGLPEQPILNGLLVDLARRMGLAVVATNDVHFGGREDAEAQLYLSCIKSGRSYDEAKARHHGSEEMYLKSAQQMVHLFADHPGAIKSTLEIAERAKVKLNLGVPMLPTFAVPDGFDANSYFRHVSAQGLEARFAEFAATGKSVDQTNYRERLQIELEVICKMNFAGYFLIVWDFIRFAKEAGIPVGPGRGSGAGSIVAYALAITDLDPIPYNLLFERFLNPERVSMPDFDIDFCMDRRDEVIQYVQQRYGADSVGQIATFAELKPKSTVKDVARCLGITPTEAQLIANLIPRKTPAETYSIGESLEIEPRLKARYDTEPKIKELLDQAQKLEGLTRHAGKHAAGIVISEGPLWDHVPVFRDDKSGAYVTQYYKDDVEQAGLVKFDFLGLKTLTVIDIAQRIINARPDFRREGKALDVSKLPLDDKATFALLGSGETKGVFQLESSGMQQLFKDLRADCFEDIVAAVALYRPGPLGTGMVADFVNRKHGKAPIGSMHPRVDELLAPTYGVIVYQEQVMQIAQALAGYTLGGADLLRRAMGKKKPEEMAKQKSIFVDGAVAQGVDIADAERIFGLLEYFAGYGFNKSHSAAYALITYQTAYLKAHYPVELLCAILTSDKDRIEKIVRTIADARSMGIVVLPPDANESETDFRVVYAHPNGDRKIGKGERVKDACGPQIRFGLGAVRGLGGGALDTLLETRQVGGPFADMFDFAARIDAKKINRSVFEALIQCGAFDTVLAPKGVSRAQAFASIDLALERARSASRDREVGQTNLFGLLAPQAAALATSGATQYAPTEAWDRGELLRREKASLGFYVSGNPLDRYLRGDNALTKLQAVPTSDLAGMDDWASVRLAGMADGYRERIFKDGGGKVAFFELEDLHGRVNVKLRGKDIETCAPLLQTGQPVLVSGKVSFPRREEGEEEEEGPREPTLLLNEVRLLADVVRADTRSVLVRLNAAKVKTGDLQRLKNAFQLSPGNCPVSLQIHLSDSREAVLSLPKELRVEVSDALLAGIERIFGEQVAELK